MLSPDRIETVKAASKEIPHIKGTHFVHSILGLQRVINKPKQEFYGWTSPLTGTNIPVEYKGTSLLFAILKCRTPGSFRCNDFAIYEEDLALVEKGKRLYAGRSASLMISGDKNYMTRLTFGREAREDERLIVISLSELIENGFAVLHDSTPYNMTHAMILPQDYIWEPNRRTQQMAQHQLKTLTRLGWEEYSPEHHESFVNLIDSIQVTNQRQT